MSGVRTKEKMSEMCSRFVIAVILVVFISEFVYCDPNEICSKFSGRRIYLDENGHGSIQAVNISTSNLKNVRLLMSIYHAIKI